MSEKQKDISLTEDMWMELSPEDRFLNGHAAPSISYWKDVRRRFNQNKTALVSLMIVIILYIVAIVGPMLMTRGYSDQDYKSKYMPMLLNVRIAEDGTELYLSGMGIYLIEDNGKKITPLTSEEMDMEKVAIIYKVNGQTYYTSYDKESQKYQLYDSEFKPIEKTRRVWNFRYILGSDSLGRDMFTRLIYGSRISLLVALISTIMTVFVGILYGGISGYLGGNIDAVLMRVVEVIDTVPSMLYVILLMVYLGPGIQNLIITMVITSWTGMARLVRAQVLSLRQNDYVLAAKAMGVNPFKIVVSHLIPNCMGIIIVQATARIPGAIFTEAYLSFIGLGVMPPMPSWGSLCNEGMEVVRTFPSQTFIPAAAISITMFAFNFLGDGLRDAFDPRLKD